MIYLLVEQHSIKHLCVCTFMYFCRSICDIAECIIVLTGLPNKLLQPWNLCSDQKALCLLTSTLGLDGSQAACRWRINARKIKAWLKFGLWPCSQPPGKEKGPKVELLTNSQWCNQPHQYNKAFIDSQKDFIEGATGWQSTGRLMEGVNTRGCSPYSELCSSPIWLFTCSLVKPL